MVDIIESQCLELRYNNQESKLLGEQCIQITSSTCVIIRYLFLSFTTFYLCKFAPILICFEYFINLSISHLVNNISKHSICHKIFKTQILTQLLTSITDFLMKTHSLNWMTKFPNSIHNWKASISN